MRRGRCPSGQESPKWNRTPREINDAANVAQDCRVPMTPSGDGDEATTAAGMAKHTATGTVCVASVRKQRPNKKEA